jgi:hypothetical protein
MKLSPANAVLCRQFHAAFTREQVNEAVLYGLSWTTLRELSQDRVTSALRPILLDELCSGVLKPGELAARVDQECQDNRRRKPPPSDAMSVIERINDQVAQIERSLDGYADLAMKAVEQHGEGAQETIDETMRRLEACMAKLRTELARIRRT